MSNELDVQNGWEENTHTHTQYVVRLLLCCCSVYPQLSPVIGVPWGCYGRGFLFPVDYDSVGVQLT